jgi:hypothetical protein
MRRQPVGVFYRSGRGDVAAKDVAKRIGKL